MYKDVRFEIFLKRIKLLLNGKVFFMNFNILLSSWPFFFASEKCVEGYIGDLNNLETNFGNITDGGAIQTIHQYLSCLPIHL